ncbi:cell division protein FtsA [Pikeienuella sp. HZG-20]|uniref:cell division protein FtsA n=1 Tax=Paludibacillus litoralis TaxID=3133267 RepID=UPI0030EF4E83
MNPYLADMRAMRERLRAALRRGLIAVIDVGSSKTVCLILKVDAAALERAQASGSAHEAHNALRVIGAGVTQSRGVRLGEIVEMEEAERAIRTALERAEKAAGARVDQVIATVSGARPRSASSFGEVEMEADEATGRDISRALAAADWPDRREGREMIHAMPVNFTLDGRTATADPRGMTARMLAVDIHAVSVDRMPLRNLAASVRRCDLELAGVVVGSYAAGLASLVEDEQKLGAACIDIGAGSTDIAVFLRGHLIHADSARIGGDHLTQDISVGLSIPAEEAEKIKVRHGGAIATGLDDRELIEAPYLGEHHPAERRRIPRSALIGVIRPRLEEILETARRRLDEAGFQHLPGRRIVLTGGGAQLTGVEETAQRILGRQVRIGRPMRIAGLPQAASGPDCAAVVGLALHAALPRDEVWDFEPAATFPNRRRLAGAVRWFRDNW